MEHPDIKAAEHYGTEATRSPVSVEELDAWVSQAGRAEEELAVFERVYGMYMTPPEQQAIRLTLEALRKVATS